MKDKKLESILKATLEYIEECEEIIEGEFGAGLTAKELIHEKKMPTLYSLVLEYIKEHSDPNEL